MGSVAIMCPIYNNILYYSIFVNQLRSCISFHNLGKWCNLFTICSQSLFIHDQGSSENIHFPLFKTSIIMSRCPFEPKSVGKILRQRRKHVRRKKYSRQLHYEPAGHIIYCLTSLAYSAAKYQKFCCIICTVYRIYILQKN